MVGTYRWPSLLPRRRPSLSARPASRPTKCFFSIYEMVSRSIEKRNAADQRCATLLGNNREVTSTWHRSPSPFPDVSELSQRFCWRNFSRLDRFRFSPPFRTPPDLFHGLSPSHPCNPCLTSTSPLPSPSATRRFPPWQSLSNLHSHLLWSFTIRAPKFFTSLLVAFFSAARPIATSIIPPLAASLMKALSAELNLAPLSDFDLDGFSAKAAPLRPMQPMTTILVKKNRIFMRNLPFIDFGLIKVPEQSPAKPDSRRLR